MPKLHGEILTSILTMFSFDDPHANLPGCHFFHLISEEAANFFLVHTVLSPRFYRPLEMAKVPGRSDARSSHLQSFPLHDVIGFNHLWGEKVGGKSSHSVDG